jgi:hypothetical protein
VTGRAVTVTTVLTPDGWLTISAARLGSGRRSGAGDDVENPDHAAFTRRIIRAHGRRIAEGDVEGLAELLSLRDELDAAAQTAVDGLRAFGYSWGEIASRLGTTRQGSHCRRRGLGRVDDLHRRCATKIFSQTSPKRASDAVEAGSSEEVTGL